MLYFEKLRGALNKNQQEMADILGIARSTWQLIEYGALLPSRTVANILWEWAGVAVPCDDQCLTGAERRKWRRPRPFELTAADGDLWTRVHYHCRNMTQLYEKIDPALTSWMEQLLPCESVTEGFDLLQFAYHGARGFLESPHALGFRLQPLVDPYGAVLAERQLPGLRGKLGDVDYLLWPQVRIRPRTATFRLDALMLVARKGRSYWCGREVNGPHHVTERDMNRREILKLPEIQIAVEEVDRFESVERTTEQVLKLFSA
ncbi:MAG: helix-turn-helix transcriptional regulator [Candidatus Eremiobacteraeota bacterium]|nr:helix-turn-helix transcriptional regulator [Candidatus Eremiobacteraeota bacterium]